MKKRSSIKLSLRLKRAYSISKNMSTVKFCEIKVFLEKIEKAVHKVVFTTFILL